MEVESSMRNSVSYAERGAYGSSESTVVAGAGTGAAEGLLSENGAASGVYGGGSSMVELRRDDVRLQLRTLRKKDMVVYVVEG